MDTLAALAGRPEYVMDAGWPPGLRGSNYINLGPDSITLRTSYPKYKHVPPSPENFNLGIETSRGVPVSQQESRFVLAHEYGHRLFHTGYGIRSKYLKIAKTDNVGEASEMFGREFSLAVQRRLNPDQFSMIMEGRKWPDTPTSRYVDSVVEQHWKKIHAAAHPDIGAQK